MPVFDTAAHVWRSPSYRQGKAIELANVNKQLVNQQLEQELEYYPEEFEQEKRKVDISENQETRLREQWDAAKGTKDAEDFKEFLDVAEAAYQNKYEETKDSAASKSFAWETGIDAYDRMVPGGRDDAIAAVSKGGMRPEDFDPLKLKSLLGIRPNADKKPDYTLGDTRYSGETNQPLASNSKEGSAGAKEKEIQDYIAMGLSREDAVKVAYGKLSMKVNEVTGTINLLDEITQEAREIPLSGEPAVTPTPEPGRTLWDLAEFATGPASAVRSGMSIPFAWVGAPIASKTIQARQAFQIHSRALIRALSINPRYPVAEMNAIKKEIDLLPKLLDAPELLRQRIIATREGLSLRAEQAETDSDNVNLSSKVRGDAEAAATAIRNFLAILGAPEAEAGLAPQAYLDAGLDPAVWPYMTDEARTRWQN